MVSICIDMMLSHLDFYDRIEHVRQCGIDTVEFWKWSNKDIDRIVQSGINVSIFNLDSRDEQLSYRLSRGILNSGDADAFVSALLESIPIYKRLGAKAMIALIGEHAPYCEENVLHVLRAALPILEAHDVNLVVEPLNSIDREGYSMPYAAPVLQMLERLNSPHVKMLYDIYHQSMMGDFSMSDIEANIHRIGHFHVADAPGRHEPGTGKVDYVEILKRIKRLPYAGYIGLEYRATRPDEQTFSFLKEAGYLV